MRRGIGQTAEVSRQRANVGSSAARDRGGQQAIPVAVKIPAVNENGSGRKVERFAAARSIICARTVDAFCRVGRGYLRDLTSKLLDSGTHRLLWRRSSRTDDCARFVIRVGLGPEAHGRFVDLGLGVDESGKPRRAADKQHEQSCCKRIERAEMSDTALPVNPPHALNDVVRRHSRRFVYEEQALDRRGGASRSISRRVDHETRLRPAS